MDGEHWLPAPHVPNELRVIVTLPAFFGRGNPLRDTPVTP